MKMSQISRKYFMDSPGIYCIKNLISGKSYIGQTSNVYKRLISHRSKLKTNKHSNEHLQNSFNKHGILKFKVSVLEYCDIDMLEKLEIKYINVQRQCFNIRGVESVIRGYKRRPSSNKTRKLLSDIKKGKIPSNLKDIQKSRRRKIIYKSEGIAKIFKSCEEASLCFNMKPNLFTHYIGKQRKSSYFPDKYTLEYEN